MEIEPKSVIVAEPETSPVKVITGSGLFDTLDQSTSVIVVLPWLCVLSPTVAVIDTFP